MTRLYADGDLESIDSRVNDLIERGLAAYGTGDLQGAMSFWKHALALDPDSRRACDYVSYVKRHFHMVDEVPAPDAFAAAEVELDIPFGVLVLPPIGDLDELGFGDDDSLEVEMEVISDDDDDEFGDSQPTRISSLAQVAELDEGWSLELATTREHRPVEDDEVDERAATREHRPVERREVDLAVRERQARPSSSEMRRIDAIGVGELADALEPEDDGDEHLENVRTQPLTSGDDLEEQLAAVTEGLLIAESGAIETAAAQKPQQPLRRRPITAGTPKSTVFGYKPTIRPSTATLRGVPDLPGPPADLDVLEPYELDAEPLELDADPPDQGAEPFSLYERAEPFELDGAGEREPVMIGDVELELDQSPETADVEAPPALEPERPGVGMAQEFDPRLLALDLGPAPEPDATPLPPELGRAGAPPPLPPTPPETPEPGDSLGLDLDLELGKAGSRRPPPSDVQISFRSPSSIRDFELDPPEAAGGRLEDQLAELEAELRTGSALDWQAHDSGVSQPAIAPLERPAPPASRGSGEFPKRQPTVVPNSGTIAEDIRAEVERAATPGEDHDQRTRRRIEGFIERADVESRRENLSIAAIAADLALSEGPDSAIAQKLVHQSHVMLVEVFRRYLGDLTGVPAVALPMHEIPMQELDHRTAFLLSRIDGTLSFEDILDVSGMPRLEALRYLCRLRLQGILEVR